MDEPRRKIRSWQEHLFKQGTFHPQDWANNGILAAPSKTRKSIFPLVSNLPLHPHFEAIIVSPENPPPSTPMQWLDNRWLENRCLDNRCLEDRCLDDQCCSSNSKADAVR
ncbi:hypothetical protein CGGC5_v017357 [Colletotrichum fructicola Nara gc5]|uniref:Uncharacterized protein n=1 Tax=Colletotrichum fructicola (strain Nara gc5) TaxID=1213859 RepID=A0A7J6IDC3_COLFN|nr:hypothetical protein CGGC5_v017357 [Colletotrichum fructicola Nara gc5]